MQDSKEQLLRRNFAVLEEVDPALARRVAWPVGGDHTRRLADGRVELRLHRAWVPLGITPEQLGASLNGAAGGERVLVLGIGLGEQVFELLRSGKSVVAWEHDPWLLRLMLAERELAEPLRSGRLELLLGTDLLDVGAPGMAIVEHPLLARLYAGEIRAFREPRRGAERTVVCAGGLFVEEVRAALERRGHWTWSLDIGRLSEEELDLAVRRIEPGRVFAINYTEGLAEFVEERGAELLVWEVDPATTPLRPLSRPCPHARAFTYRPSNVEAFRAAGFEHVEHLPLAADPIRRRPLELDPDEARSSFAPVAHVGSSMVDNARACKERLLRYWMSFKGEGASREEFDSLSALLLDHQRKHPLEFTIPARLERFLPGFRDACLTHGPGEDPVVLFGEIAASEKRLAWAARLAPVGLSVWGDRGWRMVEPHGVTYRGPAGHREELTRIYSICPLHWDVGRIYQRDIVTMRVFDVMACGRPVFTEENPAVHELFEVGVELMTYTDPEDLLGKLEAFAKDPERGLEMGRRARMAIEERHTVDHRVETMLACPGA